MLYQREGMVAAPYADALPEQILCRRSIGPTCLYGWPGPTLSMSGRVYLLISGVLAST